MYKLHTTMHGYCPCLHTCDTCCGESVNTIRLFIAVSNLVLGTKEAWGGGGGGGVCSSCLASESGPSREACWNLTTCHGVGHVICHGVGHVICHGVGHVICHGVGHVICHGVGITKLK